MTREEYILLQAKELVRLSKKRQKLSLVDYSEVTPKRAQAISTDLNWLGMHYSQCEEKLGYALGLLRLEDIRDYYEPSGFHKYDGVKKELERLKFD